MKVKQFSGREIVATFTDGKGRIWSRQRGEHTELILCTWRGKRTFRSKRETTQHDLIMRGPIGWVDLDNVWNIHAA